MQLIIINLTYDCYQTQNFCLLLINMDDLLMYLILDSFFLIEFNTF